MSFIATREQTLMNISKPMKKFPIVLALAILSFYPGTAQDMDKIDLLLLDAHYAQALDLIDAGIRKTTDAGKSILLINRKAEALIRLGKFEDAEKLLGDAATSSSAGSPFYNGITQTNYGLLYLHQGRNEPALNALQKALASFEQDGKSNSLEAAQAFAYLGNLYRATGKYTQAEEQLTMVLTLRQHLLPENHELIAATYNDLGLVYSMTDDDKALSYYEKAQSTYEKLHGKNHPKIAITNTNIGYLYRKLELYGDAINNFEAALSIWDKVYSQSHPSKAFVLFNLGETYMKMNDQKAARRYYDRAMKMYEESYGPRHPDIARVRNAIGNLDLATGEYDDALNHYQKALQANTGNFPADDLNATPSLQTYYDGNVLLYSLLYKAQALESRHFGKTLKFEDLTLAIRTLQVCDTLIDRLRQQIMNESDKITLGVIASEVYADGVRISTEVGQEAFAKKPYYAQAFYFAEKSKSAVLLEAISDANAKSFAGIPHELLEEEKGLKSAIALCAQKLAQKPTAAEEKYLRETSFSLNRSYEAFTKKLETQFPEYFNLKFNSTAPSIGQLQSRLDDRTALLSYFIDDKNSTVYIFQITKKQYKIIHHVLPADFDKYITGLRNSIFFSDLSTYKRAGEKLSSLLIPRNMPSSTEELIILPTGRLGTVPFEALFSKPAASQAGYTTLPYLLNRYGIRYEFSAGLILQKQEKKASVSPSIFLCAPVSFSEKDALSELPGTESEVKDISALFARKNLQCGVYTRERADERVIKSGDLKKYAYLHFATHGVVDENNPELSRIFLQSDTDAEDGYLYAGEIYNLQLDANLVTLSACQTGLGKISKGEGVIGLSRALVYAGARKSIVSFWSVADESTALLMKDFYRSMLENPESNFSNNLRQAKISLVKSDKYAAPFYWAPFILIGF
jgi:CHAT domain-containing protein/uncharacterized protein HemY